MKVFIEALGKDSGRNRSLKNYEKQGLKLGTINIAEKTIDNGNLYVFKTKKGLINVPWVFCKEVK